jgi:nucleoside-diphosphate-sugar epimerase
VAGATGVLGRRLVSQFRAAGHEVVALSRRPENEAVIREAGGDPVSADLFDPDSLVKATQGCDVVVRAATSIPQGMRFRPTHWRQNDRVRTEGTQNLLEACRRNDVATYVQEGIVWVATPRDGSLFSEDAPTVDRLWFGSAIESERMAQKAKQESGIAASTVRFGGFYAADAEQVQIMARMLRKRRLPVVGDGSQFSSWIHVDDAASAVVLVATRKGSGIWHAVDGRPVRAVEFFETFAAALGAPRPRRIPTWLGRLVLGRHTLEFLTLSTRTKPERLARELGWSPKYATIDQGLRAVASELTAGRAAPKPRPPGP